MPITAPPHEGLHELTVQLKNPKKGTNFGPKILIKMEVKRKESSSI
jgi:hypothetical protein